MIYLGYLLLDLFVFFVLYVACMNVLRVHHEGRLNWITWILGGLTVLIGLIVDVIHNLTVFTVLFFELPKEWTVTDRLKRHVKEKTFRGKLANWIANILLNPFDHTGNHVD